MVFGLFDGSTYRLTTYRLIDVAPLGRSCDGLILAHPLQAIRMASKLTLFKHGALGADGVGNGRRKGPLQELGMCLPEPGLRFWPGLGFELGFCGLLWSPVVQDTSKPRRAKELHGRF